MPDATENFWPEEIVVAADPAPVALLKEQAALLGGRTNHAVEGVVWTSTEKELAYHTLFLKADALGDYLYKLLFISYPAIGQVSKDYPITAQNSAGGPPIKIENHEEFRKWLRTELSSDYVRTAISNLIRYVREARRPTRAS